VYLRVACSTAYARRCARDTAACAPRRPTSAGSAASSCSTTSAIPPRWAPPRLVVRAFQALYGIGLLLLSLVLAVLLAIKGPSLYPNWKWVCVGLGLETIGLVYCGLRFRRPWVVPLIVATSAYAVLPCLPETPDTLATTSILRAASVMSLFQLWFFTRPDARRYFNADGTTLF
jgi:hypothetical protein